MLVLSRKKNESIVINDVIVITVVEIRGDKVRLGIEAPREVPIHRSEVLAAIQAQAQAQVLPAPEFSSGISDSELPAVSEATLPAPGESVTPSNPAPR
jgi:carbon storage regulator